MLYIVPGFPKCGSTYLVKKVYPNLKSIKFQYIESIDNSFRDARISDLGPGNFGLSYEHNLLIHHVGFSHVLSPILSKKFHRNSFVKLLSTVPDETKIIFQIRRQDKLTQSFFQKCAPSIITKPFDIFLDFPKKELGGGAYKLNNKIGMLFIDSFNFYAPVEVAASLFNIENLHVMALEELQNEPEKYFEKLSNIFDEDLRFLAAGYKDCVNTSEAYRIRYPYWIRSALSPLLNYLQPIKKILPKRKMTLSDKERGLILDYFADSNRRLSNEFNLDLGRFGYF